MKTFKEYLAEEWSHDRLKKLTRHVRDVLTDDLRKKKYQGHPNKMWGHCYVASEAIHHMTGKKHTTPQVMRVDGGTHWFLKHNSGKVYDPTGDQFDKKPDYTQAKGCGFLTKNPSKRAQEVIRRVKEKHPEY